jgi:beta-galactosidase
MGVRISSQSLFLEEGRATLPLLGGAVHYWSLRREDWPAVLDRVREMGARVVDTYIPWSIHEIAPGRFDFSANRDVAAFLLLCRERDLYVVARPGPHINAELPYYGFPPRVLHDDRFQVRTAEGVPAINLLPLKPFPLPSYASDAFYKEVAGWFDAICPVLAPFLYPHGPIVMVQADNENSNFFRCTPYDVDYSEPALGQYHDFLRRMYRRIHALNHAYSAKYALFEQVEPPRDFLARRATDLPPYLDWVAYREWAAPHAVGRIAHMLRARGMVDVPLSHNAHRLYEPLLSQPEMERTVDVQGVDLYQQEPNYDVAKRSVLYLSGSSRLPCVTELGAGTWPWWPAEPFERPLIALTPIVHGASGVLLYMLVDRDRWMGSPISRQGQIRPEVFDFYREIFRLLAETDLLRLPRVADVLLLYQRDYERYSFASRLYSPPPLDGGLLGPLEGLASSETLSEETLGFAEPIPLAMHRWWEDAYQCLVEERYAFALGDSGSELDQLLRYSVLICPSFAYMGRDCQERLGTYVRRGGRLILGPELPRLDEHMRSEQSLAQIARSQSQEIVCIDEPGRALRGALARLGIGRIVDADNPAVDFALRGEGTRRVLFAVNPTETLQRATVALTVPARLRALFPFVSLSERSWETMPQQVEIEPYGVSIWEVIP